MSSREPHTPRMTATTVGEKKGWIALITGRHEKYGVEREFQKAVTMDRVAKKNLYVIDKDGLYEMQSGGTRKHFRVKDGSREWLNDAEWDEAKGWL